MIVKAFDRNQFYELGDAPDVISMPVRCDVVVDRRQMSYISCDTSYPAGVTITWETRIYEYRLTQRSNDKRCGSAFNVNKVDVESLGRDADGRKNQ
jgi:hypothetical protein